MSNTWQNWMHQPYTGYSSPEFQALQMTPLALMASPLLLTYSL
ncbi:MAG: hypothetical protein ACJAZP_000097 [Psychromonas sp.]|jgi:hypothetical protein